MRKDKIFGKFNDDNSESSYSYQGGLNESETYTSDDINIAAFNKNMGYNSKGLATSNTNNFASTHKSTPAATTTNKYDVNNPGYRISGVTGFSNTTNFSNKYDIGQSKPSDPYSNINVGSYSIPKVENYNIKIDLKSFSKTDPKPAEAPKSQPKKKIDFFDNLESQLKKENLNSESSSHPYDFSMDLKEESKDKQKLDDTEKMTSEPNYSEYKDEMSSHHEVEEEKKDKSDSTISYHIAKEEQSEKSYDYDKYTGTVSKEYFYPGSRETQNNNVADKQTHVPRISEHSLSASGKNKAEESRASNAYNNNESQYSKNEYNDFHNDTYDKYNDFENNLEDAHVENVTLDNFKSPDKGVLSSPALSNDLRMSDVLSSTDKKYTNKDLNKKVEPIKLEDNYRDEKSDKSTKNIQQLENNKDNIDYKNLIKELISNELSKQVTANKKLSFNNEVVDKEIILPEQDYTRLKEAREEFYKRKLLIQNADHFLINVDYKKRKPNKFDKLFKESADEFIIYAAKPKTKKDIAEIKFENALLEERKRKDYLELLTAKQNEIIEELNNNIRKYKKIDVENAELKKLNVDQQQKFKELENEFENLKAEYETKARLVEDRVVLRESKSEARKISELKRQYEIEIDNFKAEINERLADLSYYKKQCEYYENENTKLLLNKTNNIESNEKVKEVQNDNFILHEKYNELLNKYEKLLVEKEKADKKLSEENIKEFNSSDIKFANKIEMKPGVKESSRSPSTSQIHRVVDNIFEQLLIERESNIQENIIKSYDKEIDKLKNEIKLLKNINRVGNTTQANVLKEKPVLKESAEEKIKQLSKLIHENNLMEQLENEFLLNDIIKEGEVDQETFIKVIQNLKIKFDKYDIIEIFNNFSRNKENKISYRDLIHALVSKNPSSYFIQPDPTYLKELESKIIQYENKIKQYEIELFIKENSDSELFKKNSQLGKEKEELTRKISQLEDEKKSGQNILSEVLKNNYLQGSGMGGFPGQSSKDNEAIKKLRNKIKSLEEQNISNLKDFEAKIKEYENKFEGLNVLISKPINDENKELKHKIDIVEKENFVLKQKLCEIEMQYKNEKEKLYEKIKKYKRNYKDLNERFEKSEKEKEKIIKARGLTPNMINNILNLDEIENLRRKLEQLELRNKEREEHYVKLCNNANIQQVNKELENYSKKFDDERKHLYAIINQKNNELLIIKKEFEEIYKELEELKNNKK
jgi:hypothetical protein